MDDRVAGSAAGRQTAEGDPRRAEQALTAAIGAGASLALGGGLKTQLGIARRELAMLCRPGASGGPWPGTPRPVRADKRVTNSGSVGHGLDREGSGSQGSGVGQAMARQVPERATAIGPVPSRLGSGDGTKGMAPMAGAVAVIEPAAPVPRQAERGGLTAEAGPGTGRSGVMAGPSSGAAGRLNITILSGAAGRARLVANAAVPPVQGTGLTTQMGPGTTALALGQRGAAAYAPRISGSFPGTAFECAAVGGASVAGGGEARRGHRARGGATYGHAGPAAGAGIAPEAAVLRRAGAPGAIQPPSAAAAFSASGDGVGFARSVTAAAEGAVASSGPDGASGPTQGDVYLDGALMGRWMARSLAREAGRPPAGGSAFDTRRNPLPAGRMIGG